MSAAETQFTPGPWVACAGDRCENLLRNGRRAYFPHVHIGPVDHDWTYTGANGRAERGFSASITINNVSHALPDGHGTMAEHDANAALIAAAPEMYEELRDGDGDTLAGSLEALANGLVITGLTEDKRWVEWLRGKASRIRAVLGKVTP